jgi:transcriptional regulator with XRE-family HTH domain
MNVQLTPRLSRHRPRHPNRIRVYRLKAGLSQRELGNDLGLGRNTISSWERGLTCPSTRILLRLAKLLSTLAEALDPDFYRHEPTPDETRPARA